MTKNRENFSNAASVQKEQEDAYLSAVRMFNGDGVDQDIHAAFGEFQRLAVLGHADAHAHLGLIYQYGAKDKNVEIEADLELAKLHIDKACEIRRPEGEPQTLDAE